MKYLKRFDKLNETSIVRNDQGKWWEKEWEDMPKEEREETDRKKRAGSKEGKQFVPNTETAKKAGKAVRAAKRYKNK